MSEKKYPEYEFVHSYLYMPMQPSIPVGTKLRVSDVDSYPAIYSAYVRGELVFSREIDFVESELLPDGWIKEVKPEEEELIDVKTLQEVYDELKEEYANLRIEFLKQSILCLTLSQKLESIIPDGEMDEHTRQQLNIARESAYQTIES